MFKSGMLAVVGLTIAMLSGTTGYAGTLTGCLSSFGAVCPERDVGAALVLPHANAWAMDQHLEEIGHHVAPGAHAVVVLDQAGWHDTRCLDVPENITLLPLPSYSPELNPAENVWQYLRQNFLSVSTTTKRPSSMPAAPRGTPTFPTKSPRSPPANGQQRSLIRAAGIRPTDRLLVSDL